MPDVFLSYAHVDRDIAMEIRDALRSRNKDVWCDDRIEPGAKFEGDIQRALRDSTVCVFVVSEGFLASEYCQNEVGFAEAAGIECVPCRIDDSRPAGFLATRSQVDLEVERDSGWIHLPGVFEFAEQVQGVVTRFRHQPLRRELQELYGRIEQQIAGSAASHPVRTLERTENGSSCKTLQWTPAEALALCRGIRRYLDEQRPLEGLYTHMPGHGWNDCFPAWRLGARDTSSLGAHTPMQVLPDFTVATGPMAWYTQETPEVLTTWVTFLQPHDYAGDGYYQYTFNERKETAYYLSTLLATHAYKDPEDLDNLAGLGWKRQAPELCELVFIASRGIYRVAYVADRREVTFTRYLDLAASRSLLGLRALPVAPAGAGAGAEPPPMPALQMQFRGYSSAFGGGGSLSFLLFNNRVGIAIVEAIWLVIHQVQRRTPESPPGQGAPFRQYRYVVALTPAIGQIRVTDDAFKYSAGEIDKFVVECHAAERGYDYTVSIVVEWTDVSDGRIMKLETPRVVVEIPDYSGDGRRHR